METPIRKAVIEIITILVIAGIACCIVSGAKQARSSGRTVVTATVSK